MSGPAPAPGLMVVTDLDGTLLDEQTYAFDPAREALDALRRRGVPLVLATSKTQAETAEIARRLPLEVTSIVENGGAVIAPSHWFTRPTVGGRREGAFMVLDLGVARDTLVRHLDEIARELQARIAGFASLDVEQVAGLTGLPEPAARLACDRRFDEPFLIEDESAVPRVEEAARRRGLSVTRGGRFLHLVGATTDKGRALRALLAELAADGRRFTTVGLGDAANDVSMLTAVDRPVIVPRPDGMPDAVLARALPGAERAPAPGPAGWNQAILAILAGRALPRLAGGSR